MSDSKITYPFWSLEVNTALDEVNSSLSGLSSEEALNRIDEFGLNTLETGKKTQSKVILFLTQFKNPITLILLFAAILSFFLQDSTNAIIILIIILFSTILGFWQEKTAGDAVNELLNLIQVKSTVLRDGKEETVFVENIVPGDVVFLSAGDIIPADSLIIEEDELFVDEAAFTGETFPVEKKTCVLNKDTSINKRKNSVFMGSHVISGTAKILIMLTGENTEFGHISKNLKSKVPLTDFEIGVKKFGNLLMEVTVVMVIFLFGVNAILGKPLFDSLLFTLAIAVGLTPQLLPAIISVNLSKGAKNMASKDVIVKRLNSIENFGNMTVMCSDKTGTLTEGKVKVNNTIDYLGNESKKVMELAKINSTLQQGFINPIDQAISSIELEGFKEYDRVDEIPYDFIRKRLSLLVKPKDSNKNDKNTRLVTKGAVLEILKICSDVIDNEGNIFPISTKIDKIKKIYEDLSSQGYRTLAVSYKDFENVSVVTRDDESGMIFAGFISLFDPPKEGIIETIRDIEDLKIDLKVITGDNALIAKNMAKQVGMGDAEVLTGDQIHKMGDVAFAHNVSKIDVFAEIEPNQKERIILALKKSGKVVGYMGDGINDVSAIHAADVGLSVNTAVDVAKESADIVLLNKNLEVLIEGVKEGRRTFANTQKYIFMATSANFGNMFSMAGASMFLPFLPLLPKQVLLTNLMTDMPSMTIPSDNVDEEWINSPHGWNLSFIKRFMITFGVLSSIFDYVTFAILLLLFKASEVEFQTGWFMESVVSATLIVLVIRTQRSFLKSKPSKYLAIASIAVALFIMILPSLPFASVLGFRPLPLIFYPVLLSIVVLYILFAELTKKWFYKHLGQFK